jgi:hypothetical protein
MRPTGYEPHFVPKAVAEGLWTADGPPIRFMGLPFPTRTTVARLADGTLWVHSPIAPDPGLLDRLAALGPVRHLVAPNWIHYAWIGDWQRLFPEARAWAAPGVADRAACKGKVLRFDAELGDATPAAWSGDLDQHLVDASRIHREVVFFHCASRTLILTDLIENFEPHHVPLWTRPLIRLAGNRDPDGKPPLDMRASFDRAALRASVERMLAWEPERIVLAHGRCYESDGAAELRRAFRWVL